MSNVVDLKEYSENNVQLEFEYAPALDFKDVNIRKITHLVLNIDTDYDTKFIDQINAKLETGQKEMIMLGTHSLNSILGLDSNTRLPSMINSINEIYGTSGTSVSIDDGSSISNVMSQRMYLLNKHREFSIILSIQNLYLITEVFQNGIKLNIKLPEVFASKTTKKDPRDLLMSKRAIFIYRGEEDDD